LDASTAASAAAADKVRGNTKAATVPATGAVASETHSSLLFGQFVPVLLLGLSRQCQSVVVVFAVFFRGVL